MMYGMKRTTLYLPDDLKASVERLAADQGRSEAEFLREAIRNAVEDAAPPRPRLPLLTGGLGDPTLSERVDEHLDGFGER